MSLEGVQQLLGHRSIYMTLVYARVAPKKLCEDYLKALDKLEKNVLLPTLSCESNNRMDTEVLEELLGRLRSRALEPSADKKRYGVLIRRTKRLKTELATLQ